MAGWLDGWMDGLKADRWKMDRQTDKIKFKQKFLLQRQRGKHDENQKVRFKLLKYYIKYIKQYISLKLLSQVRKEYQTSVVSV